MSENYKSKKIGVTALCRVSAAGGSGIYLYVPKNFAEVYNLAAAEYCEVHFVKSFFKSSDEVVEKVRDLTSRKKAKK